MRKLLDLFRLMRRDAQESDFGRRFGWFIERDGECLGELEYLRWDESSQFWHEYQVSWRRTEGDPSRIENWAESGITLRNREFSDVVVREFLTASGSREGVVSIRNAFVPDDYFRKSIKKANKLWDATGGNAPS